VAHPSATRDGADVVLVPATTALYRLARPRFWPATPSTSSRARSWTRPSSRPSSRWPATSMSRRW
jgi:hypothetical protein